MMHTFVSLFKNKETRNRIFFTLAMLLIYRVGAALPVPGVNTETLAQSLANNSLLSIMNMLGGGALERLSIFAMGVTPYITASYYHSAVIHGCYSVINGNDKIWTNRPNED